VNFYGADSSYVISGSDCGRIFFWDKKTEQIVQALVGDVNGVVNVLEPHPSFPILATSGLDYDVKVWSPIGEELNDLKNLPDVITNTFF
jgi:WD repeat-containing protein 42A